MDDDELAEVTEILGDLDEDELLEMLEDFDEEDLQALDKSDKSINKPTIPKIGRNELVTVEYSDGTIKENVKFKKVKDDVSKGICKLLL